MSDRGFPPRAPHPQSPGSGPHAASGPAPPGRSCSFPPPDPTPRHWAPARQPTASGSAPTSPPPPSPPPTETDHPAATGLAFLARPPLPVLDCSRSPLAAPNVSRLGSLGLPLGGLALSRPRATPPSRSPGLDGTDRPRPLSSRSRRPERCASSSTDSNSATGGQPATNIGFHANAGAAATFAANETAMPSKNASHTTLRARRPTPRAGVSNPTVANSNNPSTDNGHKVALTASAPPCNANSRWCTYEAYPATDATTNAQPRRNHASNPTALPTASGDASGTSGDSSRPATPGALTGNHPHDDGASAVAVPPPSRKAPAHGRCWTVQMLSAPRRGRPVSALLREGVFAVQPVRAAGGTSTGARSAAAVIRRDPPSWR